MTQAMTTAGTGQSLDNVIPVYIAEVDYLPEHTQVAAKAVHTVSLPARNGLTYNAPVLGNLTASVLVSGVIFDSPSELVDGNWSCSPREVGVQTLWPDRDARIINFELAGAMAKLTVEAIEYKREIDLMSLYPGFSQQMGSGTAPATANIISAGKVRVMRGLTTSSRGVTPRSSGLKSSGPYFAILHAYHQHDLFGQTVGLAGTSQLTGAVVANYPATAGISEIQARWFRDHFGGDVAGATVLFSGNLPITNSKTHGVIMSKQATRMVQFQGMQRYKDRTKDGRATLLTVWVDYGFGEFEDGWGIDLYLDATAPDN